MDDKHRMQRMTEVNSALEDLPASNGHTADPGWGRPPSQAVLNTIPFAQE